MPAAAANQTDIDEGRPMTLVLGRYDAAAIRARLAEAGVLRAIEGRGFTALEVAIETVAGTVPHVRLYGTKDAGRHLLLDAILLETMIAPSSFAKRRFAVEEPMKLLVVHWLREEDPTAAFSPERPPLPVQRHPGLGILRRAFAVIVAMARELGKDGVASVPKLYHDAVIFYRSRLFLFFDPGEQGRFEALTRDLAGLALGDASLALIGGCVRDATNRVVCWQPGLLVLPLSPALTAYFHTEDYTAEAARTAAASTFCHDPDGLARTRAMLAGEYAPEESHP
ncbi:MAG TPA: hypothetical protein VGK30_06115 [Candidatus Binatia bacterium]|jgi:hypothetical protein